MGATCGRSRISWRGCRRATVRFGMMRDGGAITVNSQIVTAFDLWFPKDDRQRVLWPSTVRLSLDYFESLKAHAVPLDERALSRAVSLGHGARSLRMAGATAAPDTRNRTGNSSRGLRSRSSSGGDYERLRKFREKFMQALRQVCAVYPAAKIDVNRNGLFLYTSPPPVVKTGVVVQLPRQMSRLHRRKQR